MVRVYRVSKQFGSESTCLIPCMTIRNAKEFHHFLVSLQIVDDHSKSAQKDVQNREYLTHSANITCMCKINIAQLLKLES